MTHPRNKTDAAYVMGKENGRGKQAALPYLGMEKRLEKRLDDISKYLLSHGKASVKELSDSFGVTMETIRKDLEFLQRKGILFRTHGGAVLRNSFTDVPIDVRTQEKIEVKKAICMEVINFIHDDDVVFVDPSSTALPLGKLFSFRKNLLIITNCFEMMNELKESRNEVVFLGGKYSRSGNRTEGQFVSDMASRFSYDVAVFGTDGCLGFDGPGTQTEDAMFLNEIILRRSKCKLLITLAEKFARTSRYQYGVFQNFDALMTDKVERSLRDEIKAGRLIEVNRFDSYE